MMIVVDIDNGTWAPMSSMFAVDVPVALLREWEDGQVSDTEIAKFARENGKGVIPR